MRIQPSSLRVIFVLTLVLLLASSLIMSPVSTKAADAHISVQSATHVHVASTFDPETDIQPLNAARQNDDPFVLVHGLGGFGRDELYGYKYWGGFTDIQQDLDAHGYTTYTAAVGPFSSNWDRACELYAQIKGGTVDYGQVHSSKYGYTRYGRTYPGLYSQWGEVNPTTGQVNKIHLIAHSMGGQTVRVLAQLLEHGSADEQAATSSDQLSPLFNGNQKSWIDSIFTISASHNGSTFTGLIKTNLPFSQQIIAFLATVQGYHELVDYDFDLDQWGLKRESGESLSHYIKRISNSKLWKETKDSAAWDASPAGAKVLNSWVTAQPDIYYFSVANEQTFAIPITHYQVPEPYMNPLFDPSAFYMGSYTGNRTGEVTIDQSWWQNDGVVNTNSMAGPTIGSTDQIVLYSGTPAIGKWNYLGIMHHYGHLDIVGMGLKDMRPWYQEIADFLVSLPQ